MPKVTGMLVVRPLPPAAQLADQIKRRMVKNLRISAASTARKYNLLVADWKPSNKPIFRHKVAAGKNTVAMFFVIINSERPISPYSDMTIGQLFHMWETTGAVRHDITPKGKSQGGADVLRFEVRGEVVYTTYVDHPGFKPRRKTPEINRQAESKIDPIIQRSVGEGMQGMQ